MSWRSTENLRRMGGTAEYSFTEVDSFPIELEEKGTGLAIANNPAATSEPTVVLTAVADDTGTGNSNIASVEYTTGSNPNRPSQVGRNPPENPGSPTGIDRT